MTTCLSERQPVENSSSKLSYRAITVLDASFRYRVKRLETEILFTDGSSKAFPNWDIKGCRERHYMEEYVNVPVEDYLRHSIQTGDVMEYGIKASDIRKFILDRQDFFEDLLLDAAANTPLE